MPIKPTDSSNTLKAQEYAAIHLKVPNSGADWLDQMILRARELDAEGFRNLVAKSTQKVDAKPTTFAESYKQAKGRTDRVSKASKGQKVSPKRKDEVVKELNPEGKWD